MFLIIGKCFKLYSFKASVILKRKLLRDQISKLILINLSLPLSLDFITNAFTSELNMNYPATRFCSSEVISAASTGFELATGTLDSLLQAFLCTNQ